MKCNAAEEEKSEALVGAEECGIELLLVVGSITFEPYSCSVLFVLVCSSCALWWVGLTF